MGNDLRKKICDLRILERGIKPDAAWVKNTREILLMQVKNTLPTEQVWLARRVREALRTAVSVKLPRLVRKPALAIMSTIALLAGGSMLSVSAAENSLPGDFFYGLKLVTEQARLALTSAKDQKLVLKTKFTDRRVTELKQIVSKQAPKERVGQVAETLKRDLKTLKDQLTDISLDAPADKVVAAAKLIDKKTNEVISALQETKDQLPPESKEKVIEAQSAAAETGVKAIEVLVEKNQESSDQVQTEEVVRAIQEHTKLVAEVTASSTLSLPPESLSTSTAFATSTLPAMVNEMKDQTAQAFAKQKELSQLKAASSTLAADEQTSLSSSSTPDAATVSVSSSSSALDASVVPSNTKSTTATTQ